MMLWYVKLKNDPMLPPYHFGLVERDIVVVGSSSRSYLIAVWLDILEEREEGGRTNFISFWLPPGPKKQQESIRDIYKRREKCHGDHVTWQHNEGEEEENGAKKKPSGPDSAAPPNPK